MARLLNWPEGLHWNQWKPLNGPQAISSGANTTIGDVTQTIASPFGARFMQFSFPPMRGQIARRARGLITALHMGANAVRVPLRDWDGLTMTDAGMQIGAAQKQAGIPWSNGAAWSSGKNWKATKPNVPVVTSAAKDASLITLGSQYWGHSLDMGDWIGFFPLHFGLYEVTAVLGPGQYRIWPPLRQAIGVGTLATLYPVMAMRLLASNLPDATRSAAFLEGLTISLFEVFDYDARDYFTD